MNRNEAKRTIALYELEGLPDGDKLDILEFNYWFFDDKDGIIESIEEGTYPEISESFIDLIVKTRKPVLVKESEILLINYKINKFRFASNSYLQTKLKSINPDFDEKVTGELEQAGMCPCCEYFSIGYGEDGFYDICPVCFWENGGNGPNHMTLEDARINFEKFGAMNEASLSFVNKEGKNMYNKKP